MNYHFQQLANIQHLRKLMNSIYKLIGIPYAVSDNKNNIIFGEGWQDICTKFHRACPQIECKCKQSDSNILNYRFEGNFIGYKCLNGLMDYATPIIVEGRHLATLFLGQFLHEPPDEVFFRKQAREYGFDEISYIEALRRVPIISKERVENIMAIYSQLAHLLADMGLERLRQLEAADKAIKEREERFGLVLKESQEGFWDYNIETGEVYYSPRWMEMLGYSSKDIEPHICTWEKLIHPEDKPAAKKFLKKYLEGHVRRYKIEYRLMTSSGEWKWIMSRGEVVARNKYGRPLRMAGIHLDLTERKRNEASLQLSEERFFKVFNVNPTPMIISTLKEGKYIDINNSFLKLVGYQREDVLGRTVTDMCFWKKISDRAKIVQLLKAQGIIQNAEVKLRTKIGEEREVLFSAEIINLNGEECILWVGSDITERKKLNKEMARLERLNLIVQMSAGIAHEIRNPMTTVRGLLQIFVWNEKFKDHKDHIDLMIDELDRVNSIITEFLHLARNKAMVKKPLNLNTVLEHLFPLIRADGREFNSYVDMELGKIPDLLLDEGEIRQVILNLSRNGFESMPPGGNLSIKTYAEDGEVVLSIQDQGKGLEPRVLEKFGTPFFTTKDNGTGLGLAMCNNIAARHNAAISVETSSCGTTFFVRFKPLIKL